MLHFFIHLFHINTFCTKNLCLNLFFVFVENLNSHRLICHGPPTDTQKSLLDFFFFDIKLRFASAFFQIFYCNGKPAECFVRHICINAQLLISFQRLRKLHRCRNTLAPHQIRIFKTFQCTDYFQTLNLGFYFGTIQHGTHLCFFRPCSLQDITAWIL